MGGEGTMETGIQAADENGKSLDALTEQQAIALSGTSRLPLDLTQNQDIKKTFANVCEVMLHDKYLSGKFRFNALDGRIYATGLFWDVKEHPIRDKDLAELRKFMCDMYENVASKEDTKQALIIAGQRSMYHPIKDRLNSLTWDGVPRIQDLFPKYLGAERCEYTTAVTTLLLHGAIQRVFHPGCKFDYAVILADTRQGTGKSTICRLLALNDEWFCDSLGDLGDSKKAYETIRGHWICEMGEMIATRKTKDIEAIKAYISRQADDYREPYGTFSERRDRQCIFIGTTNKPEFLPSDKTGNRRFIPLICHGENAEVHPLADEAETRHFVEQCYAEAMRIGRTQGWTMVLDHKYDEHLSQMQEQATPEDSAIGMIQEWLDKADKINMVCSRMIYDSVFNSADHPREPYKYELQDISEVMNLQITGWERYRGKDGKSKDGQYRFEKYGRQRAWKRIVNAPVNGGDFQSDFDEEDIPF